MATAAQTYAETCTNVRQVDTARLNVAGYTGQAGMAIVAAATEYATIGDTVFDWTFEGVQYTIGTNACTDTTYNCMNYKTVRTHFLKLL